MSADIRGKPNYELNNIALQFKTVRSCKLASSIAMEATGKIVLLFERIVRHRRVNHNFTQTNLQCKHRMPIVEECTHHLSQLYGVR